MGVRPLYQVSAIDEYGLLVLKQGHRLRSWIRTGSHGAMPVGSRPSSPRFVVYARDGQLQMRPLEASSGQVVLCLVARAISGIGWKIGDVNKGVSWRSLAWHVRVHGLSALGFGRHWLMVRYHDPLIVRRAEQQFASGFDVLYATIRSSGQREFSTREFVEISRACIEPTLEMPERSRFLCNFLK